MIANDFVCQKFQSLILRSGNFPIFCILIVFHNRFGDVLSGEQCAHHEVSLHLGRDGLDSEVWTACRAFSRNYSTHQNGLRVPRSSPGKDVLFQLCGTSVYSIDSGLIGIPPECPYSARRQQGFPVIKAVLNSALTAALLNQMNPILVKKIFCSFLCKRLLQHRSHGFPMT